jgi:hypothetical protein
MSVESAILEVSASLGVNPVHLNKLINFESGFNPAAKNPFTGARGLIQFMPNTARSMGFRDADEIVEKYPNVESQLRGPVLQYLSKFKPFGPPYPQSLYLSVFYPAYRYSHPDTAFNDTVRKVNPGINFVRDYVNWVEKKKFITAFKKYSAFAFFVPILAAVGAVFYNHLKRRRKDYETG